MDEIIAFKAERKRLRRHFSVQGWTLLVYYLIMNVCVILATTIQTFIEMYVSILDKGLSAMGQMPDDLAEKLMGNGWGYIAASVIGFVILLCWKGKHFTFGEIWTRGKAMMPRDLIAVTCVFMCGQLLFQLLGSMMELIFNQFGLSLVEAMESASLSGIDTFSMFVYAGIVAPIAEEILFRGLILRSMLPYGKKFAIFTSALLFGAFHGNLIQSPFAFGVGLVLGYVAVEYSVTWAMALHMFNNLIISDMMNRLTSLMPEGLGFFVSWLLIMGMSIAGLVILIVRRREVGHYLRTNRIQGGYLSAFFTAAGVVVLLLVMFGSSLMTITML